MKKFFLSMSMLFVVSSANAQIPTTDVASLIQRITMIAYDAKQLAELVEQVKQAKETTKSLQEQLESSLTIDQAQAINAILSQVRQANALANGASGMQKQFEEDFSNDATFRKSHVAVTASTRQAAVSQATTLDNLPADAERLNRLVDQSQAATGALQAQQAGNQINAELTGQLMALRQQMALQAQAENAAAGLRARSEKAQAEITRVFFGGKLE